MAVMAATVMLVSGVAYALSVQCDGAGDQDPDPGQCQGTNESDVITGTAQPDNISALRGRDDITARGGNDDVNGGGGGDDISGGGGGDALSGGGQGDDIHGGPGTPDAASVPLNSFSCSYSDPEAGIDARAEGNQLLFGDGGNDLLTGGPDNDLLAGGSDTNDLSGNGGGDCFLLSGDENERASGGFGDDFFFAADGNGDDVFCGPGHDFVDADAEDRVAANCEDVVRPSPLRAAGATAEAEVTINPAPEEFGS